jgi:DNA-binding GntR family transcriptional regulator
MSDLLSAQATVVAAQATVAAAVEESIVCALRASGPLDMVELVGELGVPRAQIRSALQALVDQGRAEIVGERGSIAYRFVRPSRLDRRLSRRR